MEKKLPKGWVETELGNFAFLKNGYAYKTTQFQEYGIPILKISNITKDGKVDISSPQYVDESLLNESFLVRKGDIVIAMSGATTGKFGIYNADELLLQNQRVGNIKLYSDNLGNKKFLFYLISSLKQEIEDKAYGGAQPNISSSLIESIQIGLPTLPEQERIVAKLDKLFAQHENIKKALERIPQLLKNFRQQVLTQAPSGEETLLKNIGVWKGGGTPSKSNNDFWENGDILWITAKDMKGIFISDSLDKITHKGVNESSTNLIPKNSILIVTRSGILRRILPISSNIKETTVNQDLKALIPYEGFNYKYLLYALNGKEEDIRNQCMKSGTTVESIEFDRLKNYTIPVPPLQEQQEIVRRVESLFAKADAIEMRYQKLKEKVDTLPQAILHKAFKGELVPQLPTDGDAKDLLEEIIALKQEVKGKKKR